jgi:hypothetical protein
VVVRIASRPTAVIARNRTTSTMISSCIRDRNDFPTPPFFFGAAASNVVVDVSGAFFAGTGRSFGAAFCSALPLPSPMFNALRFIAMIFPRSCR